MGCERVQERISWFLDRRLAAAEREEVSAHLKSCPSCSAHLYSLENVRAALQGLNHPPVPAALAIRLRVLASHERERQLARASFSARLRHWADSTSLLFDNLMRPLAVPFAGGILTALLLFGMLVPNLSFHHNFADDQQLWTTSAPGGRLVESLPGDGAPTWFWTGNSPEPWLDSTTPVVSGDDTVLELTIDATGRVSDYSVSRGQLTPEMQSIILFSWFTPATQYGRPTSGKASIVFHARARRHVRG
ncbi:MAG TPA: zf-HC2 domain-containing protein [Bryobacteraceae bacterium]|jgi:hypothetical protein